jgi:hypothetical protein
MPLYQFKATADSEPTMIFAAADNMLEAIHALTDSDLGDTDWESIKSYLDGDKRPRVIKSIELVPDEYHDAIYIGDNDAEQTIQEFFE